MLKKCGTVVGRFLGGALALFLIGGALSPRAYADFEQELRDHLADIKRQYLPVKDFDYFRELGVIARKADDAELNTLTVEIVGDWMIEKMSGFINQKVSEANELFASDPVLANQRLQELFRTRRYYEPSEEFLRTTGGQALAGKVARARSSALLNLSSTCNVINLNIGFQGLHLTGLFATQQAEEVRDARQLAQLLDCCLSWKPTLSITDSQAFETDYEQGAIVQEAKLSLRTGARNYSNARWEGDWIYRFEGREGIAEGRSHARATYRRGEDLVQLFITAAKMSSTGRINMPVMLAGEPRQVEMTGTFLLPRAFFASDKANAMTGCRDELDPGETAA